MKAPQFALILMTSTIIALLCFGCFRRDVPITDTQKTMERIRYCEWLESDSSYMTRSAFVGFLRTNESAGLSLGQIFAVMRAYPQRMPELILDDTNIQLKEIPILEDGWSHPLNYRWRKDAANSPFNPRLLAESGPVIIWSSGPNGSNEFGNGDDLFVTNYDGVSDGK